MSTVREERALIGAREEALLADLTEGAAVVLGLWAIYNLWTALTVLPNLAILLCWKDQSGVSVTGSCPIDQLVWPLRHGGL